MLLFLFLFTLPPPSPASPPISSQSRPHFFTFFFSLPRSPFLGWHSWERRQKDDRCGGGKRKEERGGKGPFWIVNPWGNVLYVWTCFVVIACIHVENSSTRTLYQCTVHTVGTTIVCTVDIKEKADEEGRFENV